MRQKGFTIVELLVATVVFSLILLVAMAGILQITKMYNKGVNQSRVQEAARSITDEIAETIRFTNESVVSSVAWDGSAAVSGPEIASSSTHVNYFCIGSKRYTYAIDRKLEASGSNEANKLIRHVLWVDQEGCATAPASDFLDNPPTDGRELLSENMRLVDLSITQIPVLGDVFEIRVSVAYGEDETQNDGPLVLVDDDGDGTDDRRACKGFQSGLGGEFCAVSSISVTAERRLQ